MVTILEEFRKNGQQIFSKRSAPNFWASKLFDLSRSVFTAKYSSDGLRNTIERMLGANTLLGNVKHPVIVPAVNVSTGRPKVFKSPHHVDLNSDRHSRVVDVALATSAAPSIFPLAKVGECYYADGGLFANSPDAMALHEATHRFDASEDSILMLSVGTTDVDSAFVPKLGASLGLLRWGYDQRLLSLGFACQEKCTHHMMEHRLGERFVRGNTTQSTAHQAHVRLDIASVKSQEVLQGLAEDAANQAMGNPCVRAMLTHSAPTFSPVEHLGSSREVGNSGSR